MGATVETNLLHTWKDFIVAFNGNPWVGNYVDIVDARVYTYPVIQITRAWGSELGVYIHTNCPRSTIHPDFTLLVSDLRCTHVNDKIVRSAFLLFIPERNQFVIGSNNLAITCFPHEPRTPVRVHFIGAIQKTMDLGWFAGCISTIG